MVLHLAEHLDVPLRDRNQLLLTAGFAPVYQERSLHSPQMLAIRESLRLLLAAHEPYPAVVVDRWWNLVEANQPLLRLTADVAEELLEPPVNVLRLTLHHEGLASRITNLDEWRAHLLSRLRRQIALTNDSDLSDLLGELESYQHGRPVEQTPDPAAIFVPLRLRFGTTDLTFLSTVATFGTPLDITVAELVIESFFPADDTTTNWFTQHPAQLQRSRTRHDGARDGAQGRSAGTERMPPSGVP